MSSAWRARGGQSSSRILYARASILAKKSTPTLRDYCFVGQCGSRGNHCRIARFASHVLSPKRRLFGAQQAGREKTSQPFPLSETGALPRGPATVVRRRKSVGAAEQAVEVGEVVEAAGERRLGHDIGSRSRQAGLRASCSKAARAALAAMVEKAMLVKWRLAGVSCLRH